MILRILSIIGDSVSFPFLDVIRLTKFKLLIVCLQDNIKVLIKKITMFDLAYSSKIFDYYATLACQGSILCIVSVFRVFGFFSSMLPLYAVRVAQTAVMNCFDHLYYTTLLNAPTFFPYVFFSIMLTYNGIIKTGFFFPQMCNFNIKA